jgi:hypothetical protein
MGMAWIFVEGLSFADSSCWLFDLLRFALAASSSNGWASLTSMVRAPVGHSPMQAPRPSQKASLTTRAFPSASFIAPSEQAIMQLPQPLHNDSSILIIFLWTNFPSPSAIFLTLKLHWLCSPSSLRGR